MEPNDDPKLRRLLKEWQVENAPASLDTRVLDGHTGWWRGLLTGSVRVPAPVALACAAALVWMGLELLRARNAPAPAANPPVVNVTGYQPMPEIHVRVIRSPQ